jgi:hypothetical protein
VGGGAGVSVVGAEVGVVIVPDWHGDLSAPGVGSAKMTVPVTFGSEAKIETGAGRTGVGAGGAVDVFLGEGD